MKLLLFWIQKIFQNIDYKKNMQNCFQFNLKFKEIVVLKNSLKSYKVLYYYKFLLLVLLHLSNAHGTTLVNDYECDSYCSRTFYAETITLHYAYIKTNWREKKPLKLMYKIKNKLCKVHILKLDGVATLPLVADPFRCNFTTKENKPIWVSHCRYFWLKVEWDVEYPFST